MDMAPHAKRSATDDVAFRTFLIADIRGYTTFTRIHGDAMAAKLAKKFADLARDAVEARGGSVIELRGDEALAVFSAPDQAVRAAVELQAIFTEATAEDSTLPFPVGVGIDTGEAVAVEGGFRGVALNMAARLCSRAVAGQVLVTRGLADLASNVDGVRYEERSLAELKGFEGPVELLEAVWEPALRDRVLETVSVPRPIPLELDDMTPLVDREHEGHWLRGTWRQARRGRGRLLFISGPAGIGKTRLVGELAAHMLTEGAIIHYVGAGGAGVALAISSIRKAASASAPTLLALDDLDVLGGSVVESLHEVVNAIEEAPVLVIGAFRDAEGLPDLAALVDEMDARGDGHRRLGPFGSEGVREIARVYVGEGLEEVPIESMMRASGGVPGRIHELVSAWARDEAKRRLAAAAQWLSAGRSRQAAELEFANNVIALKLERLFRVGQSGRTVPSQPDVCPFKGLASFEVSDAAFFFGRERFVGELAARTVGMGLLGVVGASGSGKSSLVAGGLLPSLQAALLPGSERWHQVIMRPGARPMRELGSMLASMCPQDPRNGDPLQTAVAGISEDSRLILVVDQLEELFTTADEEEKKRFIQCVVRAAREDNERFVAVVALRADFYGQCAPYPELAALLAANHVLVGPMSPDELRRAIELPARRVGLRVESNLVEALVSEVAGEAGGLPLLSTALVELWLERQGDWLTLEAYERTGGVRGAVARLAEKTFAQLSEPHREVARKILLRLVGSGEGEGVVRRRVPLTEFDLDRDLTAADVLRVLTEDRLLTMGEEMVEVAHEALIREWPRFTAWIEEDRAGLLLHRRLTDAAAEWERRGRDESVLYRRARLAEAVEWRIRNEFSLNDQERAFLEESVGLQEREAIQEEARRQREVEDARSIAGAQRRAARLFRWVAVVLLLGLVASGVAGFVAIAQKRSSDRQRKTALSRELAVSATSQLQSDPGLGLLLAIRAAETAPTQEAYEALLQALTESREHLVVDKAGQAVFSPDGRLMAVAMEAGVIRIFDVRTREEVGRLERTCERVFGLAFSPNGKSIATGCDGDGTSRVWDLETEDVRLELKTDKSAVSILHFSADGGRLLTAGDGAGVWDAKSGRMLAGVDVDDVYTAMLSSDGRAVLTGSLGSSVGIRLWEADTGTEIGRLSEHEGATTFSPDGRSVAVGDDRGDISLFDVPTGVTPPSRGDPPPIASRRVIHHAHSGSIFTIRFSHDGRLLITGGADKMVRIWDVATGEAIAVLTGHAGAVTDASFSSDGKLIVTASQDGTARIWDASTAGSIFVLRGHTAEVVSARFNSDGRFVLTQGGDGTVRAWRVSMEQSRVILRGHTGTVLSVTFSPDGRSLATGSEDRTARVWDLATRRAARVLTHPRGVLAVTFDPEGKLVATGGEDGEARAWRVATAETVAVLEHSLQVNGVSFSPDGRLLATGGGLGLSVWEKTPSGFRRVRIGQSLSALVATRFSLDGRYLLAVGRESGVSIYKVLQGGNIELVTDNIYEDSTEADFSPDAKSLVVGGEDGVARVIDWAAEPKRILATFEHPASVNSIDFSPDGRFVVTGCADGLVRVWDVKSGRVVTSWGDPGHDVRSVSFSPNGKFVAAAGVDGLVRLDQCDVCGSRADLLPLARSRVSRTLTPAERAKYLHEG
jgi:WD40 repeat protein/class 3 adenylate cyclase